MKCHEFEAIIISMARRQLVEVAARETALAHLDRCARCATLSKTASHDRRIRVAAESLANQGPSPRVEEALRRAFRERAGRLAERRITPQPAENGRWSRRVIGAAAAAILFLALLAGANWLKSPPANQKQEATNLPATPSVSAPGRKQESQARAVRRRNQNQKTASNSAGLRRLSKRHGVRQNAENANEVATRFYPLVEEGEMAPLESGLIVRVEAPPLS